MSFINTKGKFHVALNGTGLLLEGAPGRLSYTVEQAPLYGTRFASGDRSYNDLAQWWYLIQTDWSGGIKETVSWEDDAKYYFSSNIDAQTRVGSIKLALAPASVHTFTENILCGQAVRNSNVTTVYKYYGCDNAGTSKATGYEYDNSTYTEVISTALSTASVAVSFVRKNQRTAFFGIYGPTGSSGSGTVRCVVIRSGSTTTDVTPNITSKTTIVPRIGHCMASVNSTAYIFVGDGNGNFELVKTSTESPTADANWTLVTATSPLGIPVAAEGFGGNVYYLLYSANTMTLRKYDIAANTHTDIQAWNNVTLPREYGLQNLLTLLPGKLIVTVPNDQIWEYDGSTITKIYDRNAYKVASISSTLAVGQLTYGAIASQNKAWWGNLSYDGTDFFNDVRPSSDADADTIQPLFSDEAEKRYYVESANTKIATAVNPSGSVYKTGASHSAMMILSQHDKLQSIDKLLSSVTVGFDPLVSGQSVEIYYTAAQTPTIAIADWTSLGTISYTADGGVVTSKVLKFPVGTLVKKVWIRINLVGGGSNTPTVNDASLEYQPQPTQKKLWSLNINARDEIKDLAGNLSTKTGRELKSVLQFAWWTKSLLDFQDLDYAATTLTSSLTSSASSCAVADTSDFPEQGRIKIGDEEIFYTGKTRLSFTGLTRGVRDTLAVAHSSSDEVHNGYSVIMTSYGEKVPLMHEDKQLESTVGVSVREV